jgi:hypothetical protein
MKRAVVGLVLVGVLAACGGGGGSSKSSSSSSSSSSGANPAAGAFCRQLSGLAQQLAQRLGGSKGPTSKADFDAIADLYSQLINGAPPEVKPALTDLVAALREGGQALADPAKPDVAKLQDFQTKLAADSQKMSTYTGANCK